MRNNAIGPTTLLSALALAGAFSFASPAHACSGVPCRLPELWPKAERIPVNASAFLVSPYDNFTSSDDALAVVLEKLGPDTPMQVPVSIVPRTPGGAWVVPDEPLEVGARYRVTASTQCDFGVDETLDVDQELEVVEAAPRPTALGATVVHGRGRGNVPVDADAGCWDSVEVGYVDVQPDFADVDPAMRAVLVSYRVVVDGESFAWPESANGLVETEFGDDPFAAEAWRKDPEVLRLWTWCDEPDDRERFGLAPGEHEVYIEAEIPGPEGIVVRSAATTVRLACDDDSAPPSDSGEPNASDAAPSSDGRGAEEAHEAAGCSAGAPLRATPYAALGLLASLIGVRIARRLRNACAAFPIQRSHGSTGR